MRELGLNPANAGTTRTIRRRAAFLGLDTSHFRGNRSWPDAVLRNAVTDSRTWDEVLTRLGLSSRAGGERTLVKAHALRNNALLVPYDPEVIDLFFIVDGDLTIYVIPSRVVGGRTRILLRSYKKYIVGNAAGLIHPRRRGGTPTASDTEDADKAEAVMREPRALISFEELTARR
jgi:hypothetical protein